MRLYLPNNLLRRPGADLSDVTGSVQTGPAYWDPDAVDVLVVPLDPEPSAVEAEAIRRRLVTADPADEARYVDLLTLRETAAAPFEVIWLDTELSKYEAPPEPTLTATKRTTARTTKSLKNGA